MDERIYARLSANSKDEYILPEVTRNGDKVIARVKKEQLKDRKIETLEIINFSLKIELPHDGYMFIPNSASAGCTLTYLTERESPDVLTGHITNLNFCGMGGCDDAVMVQVVSGGDDCCFRISYENTGNFYLLSALFKLDEEKLTEDIIIEYTSMPGATYADMAKAYRNYLLKEKGFKPIKERVKENPYLKYAAESVEFRVRMGWKPVPSPYFTQNEKNEPPVLVACDIEKLETITQELSRQGVNKTEVCLVGWSKGGHDGRFPQLVPVEAAYGTDEDMKNYIKRAQRMGYQIVCHTGAVEGYEVADNFNIDNMAHDKGVDGCIVPKIAKGYLMGGGLSGGASYLLCPVKAYEKYGLNELPKVRDYGFEGLHFIDELTSEAPYRCLHENHKATRKDCAKYWEKLAELSKELFGGFQSEAWFNINKSVDYIMYTSFRNRFNKIKGTLMDEYIPLWQLVFHGIVLSNASSTTVNYTLKGTEEHLYFIETGSRPLMYLYSKFGEKKNWMGNIDLRCEGEKGAEECVASIKKAYDEFLPLMHLQYEFIENHEKIGEKVYKTTYSDGTSITVDYNKGCYTVEKDGNIKTVEV